jgi:sulfhydrogenase subunit gamma (sulfur reductase)
MVNQANTFAPEVGTIIKVVEETPTIKTFQVVLDDQGRMDAFRFEPGQVAQLSLFGAGEATFVINSPPTRREYLQFSVMKAGEVTERIHQCKEGDPIGVRGPLGNWFPYEDMKGKDIYFIGGGIGMAPLRTLLLYMLDNRKDYGAITLLYGARSPQDLCYQEEVKEWATRKDMELILTVDREFPEWNKRVGLIPNVLKELAPAPKGKVAITCGPPIMIRFTLQALAELGYQDEQVITTLERRMKCGIGLCGRCNIGTSYVCVDGPVYSLAQLKKLPPEL